MRVVVIASQRYRFKSEAFNFIFKNIFWSSKVTKKLFIALIPSELLEENLKCHVNGIIGTLWLPVLKIHLASQLPSRASTVLFHTASHHQVFSCLPLAVTTGMSVRGRSTLLYLHQLLGRQIVLTTFSQFYSSAIKTPKMNHFHSQISEEACKATSPEGMCQLAFPVFSFEHLKQILKVSRVFGTCQGSPGDDKERQTPLSACG